MANIVEGSIFTKSSSNKTLVAEISDFGPDFHFMLLGEEYSSSGLCVKTRSFERTGQLSQWYLNCVDTDANGDVQFWTLRPTNLTLARWPSLKGWKMIVFND